jgi:hypothetical protein
MKSIGLCILFAAYAGAQSEPAAGRWDGTVVFDGLKVPFTMQLDLNPKAVSGAFVNGDERVTATAGKLSGGVLRLQFEQYGTVFEADIANSSLRGEYGGASGKYALEAGAYCTCGSEGEAGPDISGTWDIADPGWHFTVQRKGDDTIAHILRPEDTNGALVGRFDGLAFMLHHFDGKRAALLEVEPRPDGTLELTLKEPRAGVRKYRAAKRAAAR